MRIKRLEGRKKTILYAAIFCGINILAMLFLGGRALGYIKTSMGDHARETKVRFESAMADYERSFQLLSELMALQIRQDPDPDRILEFLKAADPVLLGIEGETYDGIYMYYQGRYLYSWDTPYSVYADSGYDARERPWYQDAVAGEGKIVFTPPYMSYANDYILTTISCLQPDGETVFAYDIKMGEIQNLVTSLHHVQAERVLIFDDGGTVIGSTDERHLGENLQTGGEGALPDREMKRLLAANAETIRVSLDGAQYYAHLLMEDGYGVVILVPIASALLSTTQVWLIPLLIMELLLFYVFARLEQRAKNQELREAYVELGQTHRRLEIALSAAQKAAAIDELTGMMNDRSFRKNMLEMLDSMEADDRGILIMLDGDHFKEVNDTYGHNVGDEVIKLAAQMIVGRIRTADLAARLHGDEFAIFVSNTEDYSVAKRIMQDINQTIAKEAARRSLPAITLSSGGVIARQGDSYTALSKLADAALYRAKETHDGAFFCS